PVLYTLSLHDALPISEQIQRLAALRTPACLDVVHQRDEARYERCRHACFRAEPHDRAEDPVRLGAALAHRDVAPDAAVGLGRPPDRKSTRLNSSHVSI